jgi:hypothetical protein
MPASLELLSAQEIYLIRAGDNHYSHLSKDPYDFVAILEVHGALGVIKGGCGAMTTLATIRDPIAALGKLRLARWERYKLGCLIEHTLEF